MPALPTKKNDPAKPSLPELFEGIYARLKELSSMFMRHQPVGHTLQPTAIVHEAFVKLAELLDLDSIPTMDDLTFPTELADWSTDPAPSGRSPLPPTDWEADGNGGWSSVA